MATRRGKARTPEGAVQKDCLTLFRFYGFPCWRINSGAMRYGDNRRVFFVLGPDGKPFHGFSDLIFLIPGPGRWGVCEVKPPGGKPTPHQRAFLETVRDCGAVAIMISDALILGRVLHVLEADPWARFTIEGEEVRS